MAEENTDPLITAGDEELDCTNTENSLACNSVSDNIIDENHAHQLRSSLDSYLDKDRTNSNSARKQKSSNKSQRRFPNYLRASTSSCHDLCKYGRRTASEEEKPWISPRRRTAKSPLNKLDSVEIVTPDMKKKEKFGKHEGSADTKERISSEGNDAGSYSPEEQLCPNTKSDDPKLKRSSDAKSYSIGKGKNASGKEAHHLRKHKSSPREKPPPLDPPKIVKKEITAEKTYDQPIKLLSSSAESKHDKVRSSSLAYNSDGLVMKGRRNPEVKTSRMMTASKDFEKKALPAPLSRKVGKLRLRNKADIKDNEASERTLHVFKTRSGNTTSKSINDKNDIAPLQSSLSTVEPSSPSLAYEEGEGFKGTGCESDGMVPNNDVPVEIDDIQLGKEEQNKTLKKSRKVVVSGDKYNALGKTKVTNGKAVDPKKLQSRSASTIGKKVDKDVKPMNAAKEQPLKEKQKRTLKRSSLVISEDRHLPPVKLKFRSGKVVNVPQENCNIPRRLKFRRPKPINNEADKSLSQRNEHALIGNVHNLKEKDGNLLRKNKVVAYEEKLRSPVKIYRSGKSVDPPSDNDIAKRFLGFRKVRSPRIEGGGKGDSRIRSFRTTIGKDDTAGTEISGKKLTLKHQSVQAKKDAQVLLNNVIEETANKLVESRKSKVKALVGAFETVISLQEGKTGSHTAN